MSTYPVLNSVESSEHNSDEDKDQHVPDTEQLYVAEDRASSLIGETEKQYKSLRAFLIYYWYLDYISSYKKTMHKNNWLLRLDYK